MLTYLVLILCIIRRENSQTGAEDEQTLNFRMAATGSIHHMTEWMWMWMIGVIAGTTISERFSERANEREVEVSAAKTAGFIAMIYTSDLVDEDTGENVWSGFYHYTLATGKVAL